MFISFFTWFFGGLFQVFFAACGLSLVVARWAPLSCGALLQELTVLLGKQDVNGAKCCH